MSDSLLTPEEIQKNREALKQKFKNQSDVLREKKQTEKDKKSISQNSIESHPMYQTLKNIDPAILNNLDSMNKMIETMASKFTNDSKQKKLYKRKVKDLLEKVKAESKIDSPKIELDKVEDSLSEQFPKENKE
jgi:hypothetical protein